MIWLAVLLVLPNLIGKSCYALEIRVSQNDGQDSRSCLNAGSKSQCKSLQFALQGLDIEFLRNDTQLRILMMDSLYQMNQRVLILQPRREISVSIEGNCKTCRVMTFQCTNPEAGFTVGDDEFAQQMAQNVLFKNLEFRDCGPVLASVVVIWNSLNVSFFDCTFRNNQQAAINGMDSSVTIQRCSFINNTCNINARNETSKKPPFMTGLVSQSAGTGFMFSKSNNLTLVIKDSSYLNNSAVVHNDVHYVSPASNVSNYAGVGGGAISIVFIETTRNCKAVLDNLTVTSNTATYGGGIYLVGSGTSNGNALFLSQSVIRDNQAGQAGGGICTSQWDQSRNSVISIENCTFEGNVAPRGGGMNSFFMSIEGLSDSKLRLKKLIVRRNSAQSAPGIRFTSSLPYGNIPESLIELIDCVISEHISGPHNIHSYLAPITIQRLKIRALGVNEIKDNRGAGGMVVEHGVLHVEGKLSFTNNTASSGGGLRIWSGQIKLYPNSQLIFADNHVTAIGGALSVQLFPSYEVIHMYNTDCFLTYSESLTPPSKWKTKVVFSGNSAKLKGAAIFVTSLTSCLWDEEYPHFSFNRSLRWINTTFIYDNNYMLVDNSARRLNGSQYDIATDTAMIEPKYSAIPNMELFPGENVKLYLEGRDELDHTVYTIANVLMTSNRHTYDLMVPNSLNVLDSATNDTLSFKYLARGPKAYRDMIGQLHKISITSVFSSMNYECSFHLKTIACSPGYVFQDTTCVCNKNIPGVLRCDGGRTVYLKEGYWAGLSPDGHLITYFCPFMYCHCKQGHSDNSMPGCVLDTQNFTAQCAKGREGFLCGRCSKGLSVGLRMYECLDCKGSGWILGVVFVIVVTLCILVIYLNPSMSKDLRGPLFFFQMLPFIFKPADEVGEVVKLVAYTFEFGGPFVYVWKTCIADGITNIYALAVGYTMPLITLLIFLVAYILSMKRVIRTKLRKTSNLKSFWLIILFMYKYLVETTLLVMHCPTIDGKMRFFYDGNIECFHGQHLFMAVIALLVLITLVIPPPLVIVLLTKGYWKVDPQYLSTLTEGLRSHCLWWWAVDFARRILIVGTFVFIPDWKTKQIWMMIMCLFVFALHANFQPYKRIHTNVTESVYLFVLCILAIVQMMDDEDSRSNVAGTLLSLATIHSSILCIIKFSKFCKRKFHCTCPRKGPFRHYGSFDDNSESRDVVDSGVRTKQNLFDSIFASSAENSNNNDSSERF